MHPKDTPTRRQFLGSTLGLFGAAVGAAVVGGSVIGDAERVAALSSAVAGAAAALDPAVRLGITDKLTFPVDTDTQYGSLVCLNNFGGYSTANGQCNHNGIDIGNDRVEGKGRPLLACADGFVEKDEESTSDKGPGNTRILRDGLGTFYRYHHLHAFESTLSEGDAVVAGQVIGYMGRTGGTNWNHLHFEIWLDSLTPRFATIVDPVSRLPFPIANVTLRSPTACSD
jgi:murein DD-endopeptidase MepM/ murein hydrolase activator NlpD